MLVGMRETAHTPLRSDAVPGPVRVYRCQALLFWSWYQKAPCTVPPSPIHQISMLVSMRESAAMPLFGPAAVGTATGSRYGCQPLPSSYQKSPRTDRSAPIHHASMLVSMRDAAEIPAAVAGPTGPGS